MWGGVECERQRGDVGGVECERQGEDVGGSGV